MLLLDPFILSNVLIEFILRFDISESLLDFYDFYYDKSRFDCCGSFGDESMSGDVEN
jgi:hypothetical protein